ncbi:MAG: type II/IV secretion system protein [Verrucomicrobia bacterium]|jgi:general secretion pathway protein E/type IV pilus assembly protein PilB|nr:MAG: type II/IV secretion system protein [Verrucomicrobiota bacterium]MDH4469835.1 GspE/PulE family protein [Verrucomicrobiae bacterium]
MSSDSVSLEQQSVLSPTTPQGLASQLLFIAQKVGCSDSDALKKALEQAGFSQCSLIGAVLDTGLVAERDFLFEVAQFFGMEWREEGELSPSPHVRDRFPARLALGFNVICDHEDLVAPEKELRLFTFDPFDYAAWKVLTMYHYGSIRFVMTTRRRLTDVIKSTYGVGAETFEELMEGREEEVLSNSKEEVNVVDEEDTEASVMKFVNQILREALEQSATDIHFEPLGKDLRIRYRIDGVLHEAPVPPRIKMFQDSVISRLKIMAGLDIAERRLPQDGRIALEHGGQSIDVRVATIPCVHGENVSLRLLGQERFDFKRLGLEAGIERRIRELVSMSNGIVLVTGPTGCGKSTSLYTFLSHLNVKERRIVTIEDPVEHKLDGVIQIAVKPEIDLTFANALRSILRGDPNVIMVGEMRDAETADIAIRAALTGHLVFSTLHTNDAVGGITRLLDMGVEPFLVGSSVRAFLAQRLVRKLCPHCSKPSEITDEELKKIGFPLELKAGIRQPVGCDQCRQTGYAGRLAIMEICPMTSDLQELIQKRATGKDFMAQAIQDGMVPLRLDGWQKVAQGVTSVEEVVRVTSSELVALHH